MDSRPRLRLHLHPPHRSRSRPVVRPRSAPMDIPWNPDLQIDVLDPILRHRHRNHSRTASYRLRSDLDDLEVLASSRHGRFPCNHNCGAHLRLGGRAQVPQGWRRCGHGFGGQNVPQGGRVGRQQRAAVVVIT